MTFAKARARASSQFKTGAQLDYSGQKTMFRGYDTLSAEGRVTALYKDGSPVDSLMAGDRGTPFFQVRQLRFDHYPAETAIGPPEGPMP